MNGITDHIIFATNFSDACHAAIPTVTRWVDAHSARLTLLHVYQPEKKLHRDAESQLHSFYAEASNYAHCERRLVSGDACAGIASFCEKEGDGLLFMPPSDRTGLPRPFHVSTRARMLETLEMPIWTMGKATLNTSAAVAGKNIAVWLQHLDESTEYVRAAAEHAQRHNATLHLLHIVPDTDEGTLLSTLYSNAPLGMESALDRLSDLASTLPASVRTELHVSMGPERRELRSLAEEEPGRTAPGWTEADVASWDLSIHDQPHVERLHDSSDLLAGTDERDSEEGACGATVCSVVSPD